MSSTNRGAIRNRDDYYVTPVETIEKFLRTWLSFEPSALSGRILDPCAGGDSINDMSYPVALGRVGIPRSQIETYDIREDSRAGSICDFLNAPAPTPAPHLIISNPPFSLAREFVVRSLETVMPGGSVVMLLRLNYLGAKCREEFWAKHQPKAIYIHTQRPSFRSDGNTDSAEYAHFVWEQGYLGETVMRFVTSTALVSRVKAVA